MRLPRNWATKATREPTRTGGSVFQSVDAMFAYHCGAFEGSAAYAATSVTGRGMTTSVTTATSAMAAILLKSVARVYSGSAVRRGFGALGMVRAEHTGADGDGQVGACPRVDPADPVDRGAQGAGDADPGAFGVGGQRPGSAAPAQRGAQLAGHEVPLGAMRERASSAGAPIAECMATARSRCATASPGRPAQAASSPR